MAAVDLAKLTTPFPADAIKTRWADKRQTRRLSYVEGHTVIHRLNDATGNCWDLEIKSIEARPVGTATLMTAHVALTLPGLGTREHFGVQLVYEGGGEDLSKGCVTDAIKKCATLFGVGLELYGPDYEDAEHDPPPSSTRSAPVKDTMNGRPVDGASAVTEKIVKDPNGTLDAADLRYLHAVGKEHGYDHAGLNALALMRLTVASVGALTRAQAKQLITEMQTPSAGNRL